MLIGKMQEAETRSFSLVELLIVIAILAILMSLLMPSLRKLSYESQNLICVMNLKSQGLAYTLYCEDYNDYYPGITNHPDPAYNGKVRRSVYSYGYKRNAAAEGYENHSTSTALAPYFDNGELMPGKVWSQVVKAFLCPMGYDDQSHSNLNYRNNKKYYTIFWNALEPFGSINLGTYDYDYDLPQRMFTLGDTWTFERSSRTGPWRDGNVANLKFRILSMDANQATTWPASSRGLYGNHFKEAPDYTPSTSWYPGTALHKSQFGQLTQNFVLDDGSTATMHVTLNDMLNVGDTGWNSRTMGDGGSNWAVPRSLAVD